MNKWKQLLAVFQSPIFKIVLGFILLTIIYSIIPFASVIETMTHSNWNYYILSFIVSLVLIFLQSYRWRALLLTQNKPPLPTFIYLSFIGVFSTIALPSAVGGDIVKSAILGKQIKSQTDSAQSLLLGRICGYLFLNLFFWFAFIWGYPYLENLPYFTYLMAITSISCIFFFLILKSISKIKFLRKVTTALLHWKTHWKTNLILSFTIQIVQIIFLWSMIQTLGLTVPFGALFVFYPLTIITNLVPLTFFNVGVREGVQTLLFGSLVGIATADCLALSLVLYATLLPSVLLGCLLFFLSLRKISIGKRV